LIITDAQHLSCNDPYLVEVVENLGASASADIAKLVIKEIPDEYGKFGAWDIAEYDGNPLEVLPYLYGLVRVIIQK